MSMRSRGGEMGLLALGLVVGLVAAEGAVRLLGLGPSGRTGYAPVLTNRKWGGPTNSLGYRDDEHQREKPPGVRRVVALGDSFAWGAGVEFEDAWPRRLQRGMTRHRREPWETISLALPGMNTVEQAEQLRTVGLSWDPDVVILGYCLNDSEDESAAELRRARDWAELPALRKARREPSLLDHSALFETVAARIDATLENRRRVANYLSQYRDDYPGWIAGRKALADMASTAAARGVPFVVVVFPLFGNPLDDGYPFESIHEAVARAAREAGAHVIDLLPVYRGLRWDVLVVDGPRDEHPNEIAHRIAANVILSSLDDILPR
jgi:lysophospholipase L1-like esterase